MSTAHLVRIAYASAMHSELSRGELDTLLSSWRRVNARRGITGFLLYDRSSVFQVLEGFPEVVDELYDKIARDPRHHQVTRLAEDRRIHRSFGDWSMGLARGSAAELGTLAPLQALRDPAFCYAQADAALAAALIATFTTEPWRRTIT